MNANQIINMVVRMVMNRVVRSGVNAGINAIGNRRNSPGQGQGQADQNDRPHKGGPDTRQTTKRAKQALRAGRRLGRF